jgi:hypothetical protein
MTSRTVRTLTAALAATVVLAACGNGASKEAFEPRTNSGVIVVKTTAPTTPFDHRLLGTNVPAWLGTQRLEDPDFQAKTLALGTSLVRMPGGSWSNGYDWLACENEVEGDCPFVGSARPTDFLNFLRTTGLDGMWTLSINGTAQEAAALVAFFNGDVDDVTPIGVDRNGRDWQTVGTWARLRAEHGNPEPYPILLWEVGNEVYGSKPSAGGPECADFGWEDGWTCDGAEYVLGDGEHDGYLAVREAMRLVDPDISVGAVGIGRQAEWGDWGNEVIAKAGDQLDFYVVHEYGFSGTPRADDVVDRPGELWPSLLADVNGALQEMSAGRSVPVAITEYNLVAFQDGDSDRLMTQARNAFFIADSIGQMAANGVSIANQWNLANGRPANGTDYGLIDADTGVRSPQYYAMALWAGFGDELLQITTAAIDEEALRTYVGRADDGTITVLAINRTDKAAARTLRIEGLDGAVTGTVDVMIASALDATSVTYNGSDDPSLDLQQPAATTVAMQNGSLEHTFPALSITRIQLRPAG